MRLSSYNYMPSHTSKQHYVPKFYLKQFANKQHFISVLDVPRIAILKRRVYTSVCYNKYFYGQQTGKNDDLSQAIEDILQKQETVFAHELPRIEAQILNNEHLDQATIYLICSMMANFWVRGTVLRQEVLRMVGDLEKWRLQIIAADPSFSVFLKHFALRSGTKFTAESERKIVEFIHKGDFDMVSDNLPHLFMMMEQENFTRWLAIKKLRIFIASGETCFITSDNPVVELSPPEQHQFYGFHICERIHSFPLTPHITIELRNPTTHKGKQLIRRRISDDYVQKYNVRHASMVDHYAYSGDADEIKRLFNYGQQKRQYLLQALSTKE